MIRFNQVDVFSRVPLAGNGLAIFPEADGWTAELMAGLTREMRQFESIFLSRPRPDGSIRARIFTMEEELDFAGHPILGAAAFLHDALRATEQQAGWVLQLNARSVHVRTARCSGWYEATMEQGPATFGDPLSNEASAPYIAALNLSGSDMADGLPLQVVSTGLPYLIVPIKSGLAHCRIVRSDFEVLLAQAGAKFAYVLDVTGMEGRTWDNDGRVEDIATGSAAGPAGAYLIEHGLAAADHAIKIKQGRFVGRPSEIGVMGSRTASGQISVDVSGDVRLVGQGVLDIGVA